MRSPRAGASQPVDLAGRADVEIKVTKQTGAVTLAVRDLKLDASRLTLTNENGFYRALLLPLGTYRVVAELQGFRKHDQGGITLSAGQTAVINIELTVGDLTEAITVTTQSPMADPARIDLGRTIGDVEIHNLPLPSRNPYNFAFLQANVTGYENNELGVPRINANGSQMHTNYQLDGNTNTEKDRAGLRLLTGRDEVRTGEALPADIGQRHHLRLAARVHPPHLLQP